MRKLLWSVPVILALCLALVFVVQMVLKVHLNAAGTESFPSMRQPLAILPTEFGTAWHGADRAAGEVGLARDRKQVQALRERGVIRRPEDLGIDPREATRDLLAARSVKDLVRASRGLYRPPARFRHW